MAWAGVGMFSLALGWPHVGFLRGLRSVVCRTADEDGSRRSPTGIEKGAWKGVEALFHGHLLTVS